MNYSELSPSVQFFKMLDMKVARNDQQMKLDLFEKIDSALYRHCLSPEHIYTVTEDFAVIIVGCDGK